MRYGPQGGSRRTKSRGGQRGSSGGGKNRVYESNGPQGRVRGTAAQVVDKYDTLGKDAASAGDLVLAESFFQHAEHYRRLLSALTPDGPQNRESGGDNRIAADNDANDANEGGREDEGDSDSGASAVHGVPAAAGALYA
ncbi:MAG TPA: DUF4167 domain-containing protein [Rhodospirillaceae bacterium]|jgi:hypothetical protein|nr:DUF4167 domain-containing protein [Alphaproteobacteria bacterium]HBH26150.1 DUF4167 domain-containing protein [Rhodospirillaceae bacterium]